jgi:hypothetical protein
MLLNVYQEYILEETNNYNYNSINKKKENIIPINLTDLQQQLNSLKEIINISPKFKENLNKYNGQKNCLNDIILDLDINQMNKIKEVEEICQKYDNYDDLFIQPNNIKLLNNKNIDIYNNFGFINKTILGLIGNSNIIKQNITLKASSDKKSIAIINNNEKEQSYTLIGNIINNKNIFKLECILDYNDIMGLDQHLDQICNNYNEYVSNNLIFNDKFKDDYVSPIFDNNEIIGYGYKYNEQLNNDYSEYYTKEEFINAIHLAIYYEFINNKINNSKNIYYELSSNDYKLVSSKWMTDVKNKFNLDKINKEIESNYDLRNTIKKYNDNNNYKLNNKKNIYSIIKTISPNKCKEFNEYNYNKNIENEILPSITQVKYKDYQMDNQEIYIYNDFELISNDIINLVNTGENNNIGKNFSECYIKDGFIFINFPKEENGNNKLITLIGKMDKNNNFETESLLIYNNVNEDERIKYIKGIKDVQSFLNNYGNEGEPFTDESYNILGTIVKFKSAPKNNENNGFNINNENINVYEEHNNGLNNINDNPANDDEYNLDYQPPTFDIVTNFAFHPTIGLQNIGATCYMNATLQCFCHIKKFINYFKYNQQIIDSVRNDKTNLTASFKLLIEKLWPNDYNPETTYKYYEPKEFKEKISKMNPLFEGIAANDAKDLVNFIIMTLHIELNRPNNNGNNNNNINVNKNFINQTNRNLMFNIFWNEFLLLIFNGSFGALFNSVCNFIIRKLTKSFASFSVIPSNKGFIFDIFFLNFSGTKYLLFEFS